MGTTSQECRLDESIIAQSISDCESESKEEDETLIDPCTATSETERRYEFVSEGAQTARWLKRLAMARFHLYRDHFSRAASGALSSLGACLQQKGQLDSAHS